MKIFLTILTVFFYFTVFSQEKTSAATPYISEAKQALEAGDPYLAERALDKAFKVDGENLELLHLFGTTLLRINEYQRASEILFKAYNADEENNYPELIHLLGRAQKSAGLFRKALETYELIYSETSQDPKSAEHKHAVKEISTIKRLIDGDFEGIETPFYNLEKVNSVESDFAPLYLSEEEMLLSTSTGVFDAPELRGIVQKTASKKGKDWKLGNELPPNINKPGYLSANAAFSTDSSALFFTLCKSSSECLIYSSKRNGQGYGISRPIKIESDAQLMSHPYPFRSKAGREGLLFTSNMNGGYGGMDIWLAWKDSIGNYGKPINLGASVNTSSNEISPFYLPKKDLLFFSSQWHGGIGEQDIFYTYTPDLKRFSQIINLEKPFNSPANDTYFKLDKKLTKGLLVSNREGGKKGRYKTCCNDIYEFDYPFDSIHGNYEQLMAQLLDTIQYKQLDKTPSILQEVSEIVDSLRNMLPVPLYFHNDEPNPKTTKRFTDIDYDSCFNSYMSLKQLYLEKNPDAKVSDFFKNTLPSSFQTFNNFLATLKRLYQITPYPVVISVRGYASPLAKSDYNIYLSERRISSVQNYFNAQNIVPDSLKDAVGWATNPYGESTADKSVSDDYFDQKQSVFSIGAVMERRVEIQWLQLDKTRILRDTTPTQPNEIETLFYPLGKIKPNQVKKAVIALYNPYPEELNISEIRNSCGCTDIHLEDYRIKKEGSIPVELEIIGKDIEGEYSLELMFYPASTEQKPIRVVLGLTVDPN
ncbi:DUF1573 domain-containing protein [Luteibaculum oceani]|uniref:DUF1573 domain-containing protein n=1 Tax=Luteibaculum oceani TaxID=1294296 RepID=UPI0014770986|nr:DUF1573 domain-containing protein [Luteibaculum oceani]